MPISLFLFLVETGCDAALCWAKMMMIVETAVVDGREIRRMWFLHRLFPQYVDVDSNFRRCFYFVTKMFTSI